MEVMSRILESDVAEAEFMAGLVGDAEVVPLISDKARSTWADVERLNAQSRELGRVARRRLDACGETCRRALEASGAPELRAALRDVAASVQAAVQAERERADVDAASDAAMEAVGKPEVQLETACARARAEGRAEALGALAERERLREKCDLYKRRVKELEEELRRPLAVVPLEDDLQDRLDLAERRLRVLVGTDRHARMRDLERAVEERDALVTALRAALDDKTPKPNGLDLTPIVCMRSASVVSDAPSPPRTPSHAATPSEDASGARADPRRQQQQQQRRRDESPRAVETAAPSDAPQQHPPQHPSKDTPDTFVRLDDSTFIV